MSDKTTTQQFLVLRKVTRAISNHLRGQVKEYLATLAPLFRPRVVLGEYVEGGKEPLKGAELAYKELTTLYHSQTTHKPFNLPRELKQPLDVVSSALEFTPLEYSHTTKTDRESKTVTMTSPLKWIVTYAGFAPKRLKDLLAERTVSNEIQEYVLHTLMMHLVVTRQPGVTRILESLHFPVTTTRLPGFGELPFTLLSAAVNTIRPDDDVIMESTEISGMDAFEEIVNLEDLVRMENPFQKQLEEMVQQFGADLLPPAT